MAHLPDCHGHSAQGIESMVLSVHEPMEDPEESKLRNMLLISFEFQKNGLDAYFTNFRAKAPVDMELGELFYYFINDYNERHRRGRSCSQTAQANPMAGCFTKNLNGIPS